MKRDEIKTFMPHRTPMLLMDEVRVDQDGSVWGSYQVRGDEFFLQGHFPGFPVVPGVILCEIIAQSAGILVKDKLQQGMMPLFIGIEKARFHRMVRPDDQVDTHCRLVRRVGMMMKVKGEAHVAGELCAEGVFLMMLTNLGD